MGPKWSILVHFGLKIVSGLRRYRWGWEKGSKKCRSENGCCPQYREQPTCCSGQLPFKLGDCVLSLPVVTYQGSGIIRHVDNQGGF